MTAKIVSLTNVGSIARPCSGAGKELLPSKSEPNYPDTNRLIDEKSPYFFQRAHNPVDRYPWETEALATVGGGLREKAFEEPAAVFGEKLGRFGPAPKFPRPVIFNFLYQFYADAPKSKDGQRALAMTIFALHEMATSGMHDQIVDGFHGCSVDKFWNVPHSEKVRYDQAKLAACHHLELSGRRHREFLQRLNEPLPAHAR